ncbi:MAG: hypothetical protein GC164_05625 [Phycisphaera sp.]|nr:hypothetical protein [Phycisphaera sp.]
MAWIHRRLSDHHALPFPDLPGPLEGLRIAHLSDLHVTRPTRRHRRIIRELEGSRIDLALFTGDYMDHPGHEEAAYEVLKLLTHAIKPRLGSFGVFGNHDSHALRDRLHSEQLPIRWIDDEQVFVTPQLLLAGIGQWRWDEPDIVRTILGHHRTRNAGTNVRDESQPSSADDNDNDQPPSQSPFKILLCHMPSKMPIAADMGYDLMLSGHSHGGQVRLPWGQALRNSSDLPLHLTAGLMRHRDMLCVTSRGLGEVCIKLRLFCPPQLPILTLRKGPLPGQTTPHIVNLKPW